MGSKAVNATLRRGRRSRMKVSRDRCRIERPGNRVFDSAEGDYVTQPGAVLYEGPCQFKQYGTEGMRLGDGGGERELVTHDQEVIIPWDTTPDIGVSDVVWITASDDPWAAGKAFTVESVQYAGDRTGKHLFTNYQDPGKVTYA